MELETLRMVAAAAADAAIGVNVMIDALPLDGADVRPAHVTIYNAADHQWVARQAVNDKADGINFPALAILCQATEFDQVMTSVRDGRVPVVLAYVTKNSDNAKAERDALYTNRAVLRFLRRFADNAYANLRTRNGVQLINPVEQTTQGQIHVKWDKAIALAATNITWLARDVAA